uniref:Uncharacterized protein n=1 Tax=Oryza sativa subsp. japonica TaxID=39947 RepID=Q6ETH8_ORYSJ|nr:hypothetical protein [Oryza sativa Japonica Group]
MASSLSSRTPPPRGQQRARTRVGAGRGDGGGEVVGHHCRRQRRRRRRTATTSIHADARAARVIVVVLVVKRPPALEACPGSAVPSARRGPPLRRSRRCPCESMKLVLFRDKGDI